jgi:hypothetical protein
MVLIKLPFKIFITLLLLPLLIAAAPIIEEPKVINMEIKCEPFKSQKGSMRLVEQIVGSKCLSKVYCSNIGYKESKRFETSIYHYCILEGKFADAEKNNKEDNLNSYFDFGNSLFDLDHKYEKLQIEVNTVMIQGPKVFTTAYGFDEENKLVSRVTQSVEYKKVDNRDPHNSRALFDRENGVFEFVQNDKKADLYFYKLANCSKKTVTLPYLKSCFLKEQVSYPSP